ncbi:hypothetical protein CLOP_g11645, partial [Closterium sp. NIES-67]
AELASRHLSQLLFVALTCGLAMTALSLRFVPHAIAAFVGSNTAIIPAACVYAKIRAFAWPAVLVTSVAQSASLGLQDVWGPVRCLAVASTVNLGGDLLLCPLLGYGIAGAAWATMASQVLCLLGPSHGLPPSTWGRFSCCARCTPWVASASPSRRRPCPRCSTSSPSPAPSSSPSPPRCPSTCC